MEQYKEEFIHFMVESHVLKFGSFTLKSGRQSPFFMNAGAYVTGEQLHRLGKYYAQAIHDNFGLDFDVVFGPAYKGIPLAVVTAIALQELYGKEVRYCCNRKEVKDHGADKGNLLGADLHDGDRVIMVEDVTTSGKSIDETYPILKGAADVEVKGLIVSLNRMEVGKGGVVTAQKEVQEKYGFPVASIVSMAEVVECLYNKEVEGEVVAFAMGNPIRPDMFDVNFEKARADMNGPYPMINREFARRIAETPYRFLNREDDMGLEGLRRAKESYIPDLLLEKLLAEELPA